jgi:hypothetical protein
MSTQKTLTIWVNAYLSYRSDTGGPNSYPYNTLVNYFTAKGIPLDDDLIDQIIGSGTFMETMVTNCENTLVANADIIGYQF